MLPRTSTPVSAKESQEKAKSQRLKFILLRNTSLSLVAYCIGLAIGYIMAYTGLSPYGYQPLNVLAAILVVFHLTALVVIYRKPILRKSDSNAILWTLLGIWFVMYFAWVIYMHEYRGMGYVQSMMTLGFAFSYATVSQSLFAILAVAITHFTAAMIGIFIFDQPGQLSSELLLLFSFLVSAGFTGYMFMRLFRLLRKSAATDPLTGLLNRRMMTLELESEWQESQRYKISNCLLMIDLDFFKNINDGFGHEAGDLVLKHVAEVLTEQLRGDDRIGRWGGEEFLILLSHVELETALRVGERLLNQFKGNPVNYKDKEIRISFSAGLVQLTQTNSPNAAINKADTLLYRAKKEGRGKVCY